MILPIDLETTIRNEDVGTMKASPFHADNIIVAHGMSLEGKVQTYYMEDPPYETLLPEVTTVVAHNLSFDLKYLMRFYPEWREWIKTGKLWCTMVAEYLLSGQTKRFPSLEACSEKYGGTNKDPLIEDYWNEGIDTVKIPEEQLINYLEGDVKNLELIYHAQVAKAEAMGMLPLLELHMEALLATIVMEYNGMEYDVEQSRAEAIRLTKELEKSKMTILNYMVKYFDEEIHDKLNPDSKDQLSLVLFGGEYSYVKKEMMLDDNNQIVYFKSGKKEGLPRLKNVKVTKHMEGLGCIAHQKWALKKEGFYSTNEEVIDNLLKKNGSKSTKVFLDALKDFRMYSKDLNTYFLGYGRLVWPDGKIHGNLNTVVTQTGRLSSSNPNLQNLTGGDD